MRAIERINSYVTDYNQARMNNDLDKAIRMGRMPVDEARACLNESGHSVSDKQYLEQVRIAQEVVTSRNQNSDIKKLVKGLMIESYIEDGCQEVDGGTYGKSITDPCLGWEKTERLVLDIADLL